MSERRYYDVSMALCEEIPVFPGDPGLEITSHMSISNGDKANVSVISMGSHTGTHIDAPKHFIDTGAAIDELPPEYFMGEAKVFEIPDKDAVTFEDISSLDIEKGDIVLFKTRNSKERKTREFNKNSVYIAPDAASYLAEIGIKTVGIDYLSVERFGSEFCEVHHTLLESGIVIIEGLNLDGIKPGKYEISALPLKISGGNGSPARVVLIEYI